MPITRIAELSDERVSPYVRLSDRQLRRADDPQEALVILESLLVIGSAVRAGLDLRSVLVDERHLQTLLETIPELHDLDVPLYVAERGLLSDMTGFHVTRGYLAAARRPASKDLSSLLQRARRVAVLEGLTDISNVGALFRSAAALGVDAIVLAPDCADPLNRRSVRVSMGTVFQIPWAVASGPWPESLFDQLRSRGFKSVALALDERALPLDDPSLASVERLALFFGSEGWGLSSETLSSCDCSAVIPMSAGVDSLNVAASSAVAFWELCRKGR
ncbi:TrmH family RNA methyltransferase [Olsenella urininfantis]|uniref:TrmH family RNA methyltransferase n=1 Tax=Olsenella urininfantis TaxID=1871033 RepID=UPI00190EA7B2|nr:RNA methyltransferase [Olsenella urininfantis]